MQTQPSGAATAEMTQGLAMRVIAGLLVGCGYLSALLILLVLGVVSYAIVQRYVLQTPLLWADEFIGYVLVALVMIGAAEALRKGDHIAMNLFAANAGPKLRRALDVWSSLAIMIFAGVLGTSTWQSISFAIDFGSYAIGHIEIATWIPQVPMLVGSVLLGLTAFTQGLRAVVSAGRSGSDSDSGQSARAPGVEQ